MTIECLEERITDNKSSINDEIEKETDTNREKGRSWSPSIANETHTLNIIVSYHPQAVFQ